MGTAEEVSQLLLEHEIILHLLHDVCRNEQIGQSGLSTSRDLHRSDLCQKDSNKRPARVRQKVKKALTATSLTCLYSGPVFFSLLLTTTCFLHLCILFLPDSLPHY
ncbi:hypothetical protein BDR07DRAFT_835061 [Suillus spraguei]|nr:hypothetical protein BDR07DRAFT_835061 [Suillus spraguei]